MLTVVGRQRQVTFSACYSGKNRAGCSVREVAGTTSRPAFFLDGQGVARVHGSLATDCIPAAPAVRMEGDCNE